MGYNESGNKAFESAGAIPQYSRVALGSDGTVSVAGINDQDIGVNTRPAFGAGEDVDVSLINKSGTHFAIAADSFDAGDLLFSAADGQVANTLGTNGEFLRGIAMESASATGDIVEILPVVGS